MLTYIKAFLYDPQVAANVIRGVLATVAIIGPELGDTGKVGWWLGKLGVAAAFFIKAGDKNPVVALTTPPKE